MYFQWHNPSLEFMSKARVCKGNGSKEGPIFKHTPTSGDLKKVKSKTIIILSILGVGALSYFEFFITRFEESYFVQITLSLTIQNALKSRIF